MATKVNRDYWDGTIYNMPGFPNVDDVGYLDGSLETLINDDTWDIANNEEFDLTVCPWGLPQCSLSSMATPVFAKDEGNKVLLSFQESNRRNMPFFINRHTGRVKTDDYSASTGRTDNKQRIVGDTAKSTDVSYNLRYTTSIDTTNVSSNYIASNTKPIVKLQYASVRAWLGAIWYFDTLKYDNFSNVGFSANDVYDFLNLKETDATKWRYKIVRAGFALSSKLDSNTRVSAHCCGKSNIPQYLQDQYYNNGTTEYIDLSREIRVIGQNVGQYPGYGNYGYTYLTGDNRYSNTVPTLKTTKSVDFACSYNSTCICNASSKRQKFDDVSYHWEQHLYYYTTGTVGTGVRLELKNGEVLPFNTSKYVNPILTLEIDASIYDNYYESAVAALMHEAAFLGFPFCKSFDDINNNLSDTSCYIPVFDYEHMITTGEYKRGDEADDLPNFTWGDIFDSSVPEYDPNYIPPEPEPEESDYGDTSNLGSARGLFPAGVNIYLMSRLDYNAFMGELNSYYANSTPDDWTLDFQGVNPSDYILNVYYTPYNFVKSDTKSNVKIGQITLTTEAYELSQGSPGVDDPNKWKYFTYGTRTVTPAFYDFRDYDPYTKVELYLPLAGTVELDTNYVMNHDITVEYYFDLMTMSGVAAVYRDSMLYKTSDFKLGAQVPLLITNMGQIQNQITQLEFSQKQNNLRLATSAISSGVSIGSILAGGGSEVSTGQTIGAAGGTFALASGIMKADEIDYQLKHTSPSVSVTGAAEPLNNYSVGQLTPKLIIKRPLMINTLDDAIYSKTIGNSCCINTILDSMTGLVVCSAIDTTGIQKEISTGVYISPTIDEVNMIKSTFNSGVIL